MSETLLMLDRWDGGLGWTLEGDRMQRTSHALVDDGAVWLVDPVDAPGLDEELASLGEVTGVVLLLDRHERDAAAIATRHGVPVSLPAALSSVADDLDCETEVFTDELPGTGYRSIELATNRFWREVALYDAERGTLVVPEAVGTADLFTVGEERLGVHPALRLLPPREGLGGLRPERILVGHGPGVFDSAATELDVALRRSRRNAPRLYLGALSKLFE